MFYSGCTACLENHSCKYSKNPQGNNASFNEHTNRFSGFIIFREATGSSSDPLSFKIIKGMEYKYYLNCSSYNYQVAGRSLGELVRKLGERVLPLIIPILSEGLSDPNPSRRQVRFLLFLYPFQCMCCTIVVQVMFMH